MATSSAIEGRPGSPERAETPAHPLRDRFIDVILAFAILALVGQHWLAPVVSGDHASPMTDGPAVVLGGPPSAWLSPVLPLIFFAGGAAATMSLRARRRSGATDRPTSSWLADRAIRIALPVLPLAAGWLLLPHLLVTAGATAQPVYAAAELVGRLIGLSVVYAALTSLTPVMLRLHDRCRGCEMGVMVAGAAVVDVVRLAGVDGTERLGSANVVLVLCTVCQAGIAYSQGTFGRARRSRLLTLGGASLAATALTLGPYALAHVAMPDAPSSPGLPAVALLMVAAAQLSLLLTLRDAIGRWAAHRPVGTMLDWISARAMTIYLWHVPALAIVAGVVAVVAGLGYGAPEQFGGQLSAPLLRLAALTVALAGLVRAFGHYERRAQRHVARLRRRRGANLSPNPPACRMGWPAAGRED